VSSPYASRRAILQSGGLVLAFTLLRGGRALAITSPRQQPVDGAAAAADRQPAFAPNAFIRIDHDGRIRLVVPNVEMGQGIYTGEATLLAEELDVELDQIQVEHAPANEALYASPILKRQVTGDSASTRGAWLVLRRAGAVARAMMVSAAAEKWNVAAASCSVDRGVVTHRSSGRRATYGELALAASKQPIPQNVTLKERKDFRLIGKPLRRLDSAGKVDGTIEFGIDVRIPDMQVAYVVSSPSRGGKVKSVDDRRARAVPGVKDIVRLESTVAVTANHYWAAKTAAAALDVEWDTGPNGGFSTEQLFRDMERSSGTGQAIIAIDTGHTALGEERMEAIYQFPFLAHAPMEPLNATVHVRADACEIWVGTQAPQRVANVAALLTGLPLQNVTVHNRYLGGGFGRRGEEDSVGMAVAIARKVPYPIKMVWSREHDIQYDIPRPAFLNRIAAAVDRDGYPAVLTARVTGASVTRRFAPASLRSDGLDEDTVDGVAQTPYELPNVKVEWVRHDTPDAIPVGFWRGVGPGRNLFTVETFMDELAHAAGKDPIEYRRALLRNNPRALGVLNLAAERFGWGKTRPPVRTGCGVALGQPFGSYVCAMVEVAVSPQGEVRLLRAVGAIDCGVVINPNTIEAQMQGGLLFGWGAALYSELTFIRGGIQQSNFHDYRVLRINETPPVEIAIVASEASPSGIGEVGTAIAAPALANAIFVATGVRVRRLPISRSSLSERGAEKAVMSPGVK
jgi:isoquinoline 1-oxidoreductase subunit beta